IRAGRFDEAAERARYAVEFDPAQARARATLGWALFLGGQREAGLRELDQAVTLSDSGTLWLAQLGEAYGMAGEEARGREILRELERRASDGYVSPYHLAYVHTGLGELDRAAE